MGLRQRLMQVRERLRLLVCSVAGSTAMMFAIALPAVLAATGVAVDFGTYTLKMGQMQAAADASAISGAKELAVAGASDQTINGAVLSFVQQQFIGKTNNVVTNTVIDRKLGTLTVNLEEDWAPAFAQFINADITPIKVTATASLLGAANICVLALNPSATQDLVLKDTSQITANGCGTFSNSTSAQSITLTGSSAISAAIICSSGGVSSTSSLSMKPGPTSDCPPIPDPLAGRATPGVGACFANNLSITSGVLALVPGTYCGGISISGTAKVTFQPGDYIIKDGELKIVGTSTVVGDHAGFFLTGTKAVLNIGGTATLTFTGRKTGTLSGLLFFEDPAQPVGGIHKISSPNVKELTGTIYLPQGTLQIDPNSSVAQNSAYTAIISNRIELSKGPMLVLNSNYGASDVPLPTGIQISAKVVLSK